MEGSPGKLDWQGQVMAVQARMRWQKSTIADVDVAH